jgi:hypothetical protein
MRLPDIEGSTPGGPLEASCSEKMDSIGSLLVGNILELIRGQSIGSLLVGN